RPVEGVAHGVGPRRAGASGDRARGARRGTGAAGGLRGGDGRAARGAVQRTRRFTLRVPSGWVPRLAIAGAAAAVIAAVVVALSTGGETQQRSAASKAPPGSASTLAGRRVERSAQLTLSAPGDRLQDIANGVAT